MRAIRSGIGLQLANDLKRHQVFLICNHANFVHKNITNEEFDPIKLNARKILTTHSQKDAVIHGDTLSTLGCWISIFSLFNRFFFRLPSLFRIIFFIYENGKSNYIARHAFFLCVLGKVGGKKLNKSSTIISEKYYSIKPSNKRSESKQAY